MILDIDETIASLILGNLIGRSLACENILYKHFNISGHTGFLNDVSVTLIDKTDRLDHKNGKANG